MKALRRFISVLLLISTASLACNSLQPNGPVQQTRENTLIPTAPAFTAVPATPTLQLEVVQSQVWTDKFGNVRANFLLHNPYDFPVKPRGSANASLSNSDGKLVRSQTLYFLDGISGGGGFLLPDEIVGANACFTCEETPITESWDTLKFISAIQDASDQWKYVTDVESTVGNVSFDGDSPLFSISGTVTNNSDTQLSRLSMRVNVFDQDGKLIGAGEVSAYDVAPGATMSVDGIGIGQTPSGSFTYESSALGVTY